MKINEIFTDFDPEQELFEQIKLEKANDIDKIYRQLERITNDFTDSLTDSDIFKNDLSVILSMIANMKTESDLALGPDSNASRKMNIILEYIKNICKYPKNN